MKILAPSTAELTRGRAATPIAFIRAIALGYRRLGMDPANALRQAQIPEALLSDPDARVTAAQMELLSGIAVQALDDEALGWFQRRLPWASYGMLCRASLTSPTVELALKVRTLHRQLKEEAVSLQRLKNDARREQAIKLLLQTRKPVKQVAAAVRFDSEKSFARAFREWTGVAPGQGQERCNARRIHRMSESLRTESSRQNQRQSSPGMIRFMNSSNIGTVKAVSP